MAAICHLDFFSAFLDHPQSIFAGLYWCAKFGWNPWSSFDNTKVWVFHAFGLKMPIHTPKIMVFGYVIPKMGTYVNRTPKRYILVWKDIIWCIDLQNRFTGATYVRAHETKNRERNLTVATLLFIQTTHNPTWSDQNTIRCGQWSSGISY